MPPPSKHQLALMIWLAVVPTLTVLNLVLGGSLEGLPTIARTFIVATIAVPIVIYGLMPHLHRDCALGSSSVDRRLYRSPRGVPSHGRLDGTGPPDRLGAWADSTTLT